MSTKLLLIFLFFSYFLIQSFLFFLFSQSRVSYFPIFLSNHGAGHPAFKDLRNLRLISYDDGLIEDGEFIVLYGLDYSILEAFSSSRSFCFCFEVKSVYRCRTALDLQLR